MDHPDMLGRQLMPMSFRWIFTASRQLHTKLQSQYEPACLKVWFV